jgi:type I restriction-modification system DNA methylase subunit
MREAIINFFTDPKIGPTDTLLFYYSGHGVPDEYGDVYFATSEIDHNFPYKRGYSFGDLAKMMEVTTSSSVVVILDCCYSGSATLSKGHEEDKARLGKAAIDSRSRMIRGEGKCILSAGQALQEAYELKGEHHSLFTYYVLRALQGEDRGVFDKHGNVTVGTLSNYVYEKIMNLRKRPKQKPSIKVESSGDIILIDRGYFPGLKKSPRSSPKIESIDEPRDGTSISHQQTVSKSAKGTLYPEVLTQFIKQSKDATTHTKKLVLFSNLIKEVFSIEDLEMEVPVVSNVKLFRGRIDTVFGDLIIEFKVSLDRELEDARVKLIKYLQAYREKYPPRKFVAIATDNLRYMVYIAKIEDNEVKDIIKIDELDIESKDEKFVFLWFDSYLFASDKVIPTSRDIRKRFGIDSPTYLSFKQELSNLYSTVGSHNQVKVKYTNWQRYLEVVYGDKPSELELFLNHTYLATFAKLLVHYRIYGAKLISRNETQKVVFGDTFRMARILNFIEEDFFTWYFSTETYDYSRDLVFRLSEELQIYDLNSLDEDVLKELYGELVGTDVRHTLGEYYTPDWLAELLVRELVNENATASFLDPACGSGTFLFSTIKMLIPALKKIGYTDPEILVHILENVAGIDINPLAVIIARTNYLLALKDIIKAPRGSDISLPIYLSDSIKIPELEYKIDKGIPNFKFKAGDRTFEVPEYLVQQTSKMDLIFEKIHGHAKNYENRLQEVIKIKGDSEIFRNGLLEALKKSLYDVPEESARDMLVNDLKTMTQLIDEGNDSIWSYILKNILRPIVFMNKKFHFVIGNPPWLAMHFMNDPDYQQFLKDETFRYKLLDRNQTHLYTHMEMATLFFCKVSDIYLEDGGKIAFVMPKSILTANHHANFMKFKFTKLQGNELQLELEKIFNMEKVRPLFNIPSCALIASKSPTGKKHPIPMLVFSGLLPARNEQWNNAKSYLSVKETKYSPRYTKTDDKSITPYYDLFYQGATMFPRNFWFVSIEPDPVFSYQSSLPYVKSDKNNKSKPPWDEVILEGSVESIFLYGTIIGSDLVPFGYKRLSLIVMPLTIEDNKFVIMQSSDMAYGEEYTGIAEYLKKAEDAWRDNATSKAKLFTIYEWLNYRNKLTNQDPKSHYKVLYAATATFLTSCVISYDVILDQLIHLLYFLNELRVRLRSALYSYIDST